MSSRYWTFELDDDDEDDDDGYDDIPDYMSALDDEDDDSIAEQNSPGKKDGCFLFAIVPVICVSVYMLV